MRIRIKKLPLRYVIYLLMLLMLTTGVSLSRYQTTIAGSATVSVARPVVEYFPGEPTIYRGAEATSSGMIPGDRLVFPFQVKNFDAAGRTEVKMAYQVHVNFSTALPSSLVSWSLNRNGEYQDPDAWHELHFNEDITHVYTLNVDWDDSFKDTLLMGQTIQANISIQAQQVD